MKQTLITLMSLLMLGVSSLLQAEDLMMLRSTQPFPETMSTLQNVIKQHGYVVSRVQRVDIGLTNMGYKTDKYRVVFFGKHEELEQLTDTYPELAAYLPLKIAIFSEETETLLVTTDPIKFSEMFPDEALKKHFKQWSEDTGSIFNQIRNTGDN
jgi:uncharacterized protein (DUF302 family)